MPVSRLDVVASVKLEGLRNIDQLNERVRAFSRTVRGVNFVLRTFGISLTGILGGAIIRGFIRQQTELSNSLARTRFALSGLGGEMEKNLATVNRFANEIQRSGIASANLAREINAKVLTSLRSQEQATRFARAALIGHKIQLFDARTATTALASSTDENTSAFRNFLLALGISAQPFLSLDSLIENFIRRNEEAAKSITPFAAEWERFVANFKSIAAKIGGVIGRLLAPAFAELNAILESPSKVFRESIGTFDGFFKDLGILFFGKTGELTNVWIDMFADWGGIIKEALDALRTEIWNPFFVDTFNTFLIWVDKNRVLASILVGIFSTLVGVGILFLAKAISATLIPALISLGSFIVATVIPAITGFSIAMGLSFPIILLLGFLIAALAALIIFNWKEILKATIFTWNAVVDFISDKMLFLVQDVKEKIQSLVNFVERQVNKILNLIESAREAARKPIDLVFNIIQRVKTFFTGTKQLGGTVQAGRPFIVGERGAEVFVPSQSGNIIPSRRLGGAGGDITIVIQGNTFMSDEEAARTVGDMIVKRLQLVHRFGLTT